MRKRKGPADNISRATTRACAMRVGSHGFKGVHATDVENCQACSTIPHRA